MLLLSGQVVPVPVCSRKMALAAYVSQPLFSSDLQISDRTVTQSEQVVDLREIRINKNKDKTHLLNDLQSSETIGRIRNLCQRVVLCSVLVPGAACRSETFEGQSQSE